MVLNVQHAHKIAPPAALEHLAHHATQDTSSTVALVQHVYRDAQAAQLLPPAASASSAISSAALKPAAPLAV